MAHGNTVVQSINDAEGLRCVDIFVRPDGWFGFEEYRREAEDPSGWRAIGGHWELRFVTAEAALDAAMVRVGWLETAVRG